MPAKENNKCYENYRELTEIFSRNSQPEIKKPSVINRYLSNPNLEPVFLDIIEISESVIGGDFTIDWSLPFSGYENLSDYRTLFCLSFAKDDYGNSFHIYDASRKKSPILYKSHDPEVIIVVAENLCEFIRLLKKYSLRNPSETLGNWFEREIENVIQDISLTTSSDWKTPYYKGLGINFTEKSIQVDFSEAVVGSGISLSFFGELTRLRRNLKSKSITLLKPKDEDVKQHQREKLQTKMALIGVPATLFIFFSVYAVLQSMPIMGALVMVPLMTVIGSIVVLFLFGIIYAIFLKLFKS